jgi:hypothetical protein
MIFLVELLELTFCQFLLCELAVAVTFVRTRKRFSPSPLKATVTPHLLFLTLKALSTLCTTTKNTPTTSRMSLLTKSPFLTELERILALDRLQTLPMRALVTMVTRPGLMETSHSSDTLIPWYPTRPTAISVKTSKNHS